MESKQITKEIILKGAKPGETVTLSDGLQYQVDGSGLLGSPVTAKPSTTNQPAKVDIPDLSSDPSGGLLGVLTTERSNLVTRSKQEGVTPEELTNIQNRIAALDTQIRLNQPKAKVDTPADTAHAAAATATAAAATKNADTNAATAPAHARAAVTSADATLLDAKIKDSAQKIAEGKWTDEQAKNDLEWWWKVHIENPRAEETAAITRAKFANDEGQRAVDRQTFQYNQSEAPGIGDIIAQAANKAGYGPVTRDAFAKPVPNMDAAYHSETLRALNGISPTATAVYRAGFNPTQQPVDPSLQQQVDALKATQAAAQAKAAAPSGLVTTTPAPAAAAAPPQVGNNMTPEQLQQLIALGA